MTPDGGGPGRAVAVVPLRDGTSGKSRLSAVLDPASRRRLVTVLARHVVGVLLTTPEIDRVVVVTADPAFARAALDGLADSLTILAQPADRPGLNAALDLARDGLRTQSPGVRLLVVHADLPALATDDVSAILAQAAPVVVATDRADSGTNLLAVDADRDFAFRFGPESLAAHLGEAAARGVEAVVVRRPGTSADLDTLADWTDLPPEVRRAVTLAVPTLPG